MKKGENAYYLVVMFLVFLILSSFVAFAESGSESEDNDEDEVEDQGSDDEDEIDDEIEDDEESENEDDEIEIESEIESEDENSDFKYEEKREFIDSNGIKHEIEIKIEERVENGKIERKIIFKNKSNGELEVDSELEIEERREGNESVLRVKLKNGNESELNLLPDQIEDILESRLNLTNHTITLNETIHNNVPRVVYHVQSDKNGRFLGVFKLKARIESEFDAETGEIIDINGPWWVFLLSDIDESSEADIDLNATLNVSQ